MSSKLPSTNLNHVARSLAGRADDTLIRLIRMLSTPAGMDKTLCTLQYLLIVVHSQLSKLQGLRYRRLLLSVSQKLSTVLLPGETVIATLSPKEDRLGHVIAGSKALSGMISDFRTFTRLWGLLDVYAWGKNTYQKPHQDKVMNTVVWGQISTIALYQWYENVAYLASKGVLRGDRFGTKQQNKWYEWSSRYWMAYIALEAVRLARVWQLNSTATVEGEDTEQKTKKAEDEALWKRQTLVNTAWAPVSYHYSWEQGYLSDELLGVFGLLAGSTGFRHMWKQTKAN